MRLLRGHGSWIGVLTDAKVNLSDLFDDGGDTVSHENVDDHSYPRRMAELASILEERGP